MSTIDKLNTSGSPNKPSLYPEWDDVIDSDILPRLESAVKRIPSLNLESDYSLLSRAIELLVPAAQEPFSAPVPTPLPLPQVPAAIPTSAFGGGNEAHNDKKRKNPRTSIERQSIFDVDHVRTMSRFAVNPPSSKPMVFFNEGNIHESYHCVASARGNEQVNMDAFIQSVFFFKIGKESFSFELYAVMDGEEIEISPIKDQTSQLFHAVPERVKYHLGNYLKGILEQLPADAEIDDPLLVSCIAHAVSAVHKTCLEEQAKGTSTLSLAFKLNKKDSLIIVTVGDSEIMVRRGSEAISFRGEETSYARIGDVTPRQGGLRVFAHQLLPGDELILHTAGITDPPDAIVKKIESLRGGGVEHGTICSCMAATSARDSGRNSTLMFVAFNPFAPKINGMRVLGKPKASKNSDPEMVKRKKQDNTEKPSS